MEINLFSVDYSLGSHTIARQLDHCSFGKQECLNNQEHPTGCSQQMNDPLSHVVKLNG